MPRADPEWFLGDAEEQRAARKFRPALLRAIRILQGEVSVVEKRVSENPMINLRLAVDDLNWERFRTSVARAWFATSRDVVKRAVIDALNTKPRRVIKEHETTLTGTTLEDADVISLDFARRRSLELAETTTLGTIRGARSVIQKSLERQGTIRSAARDLRQMIGLTTHDVGIIERRISFWHSEGVAQSLIDKRVRKLSDKKIRRRAENIARTEIRTARNDGMTGVWRKQVEGGDLPSTTMKEWVANGACIICNNIVAKGPVLLHEAFDSDRGPVMHPPAHPSCRCSVALVFGDLE